MDKIIVYLDDAAFARHQLAPMKNSASGSQPGTRWILVACPPRMTRHISKWVNHTARQNWRIKWADKLFAEIMPELQAQGDTVTTVLAHGPLLELTQELLTQHGAPPEVRPGHAAGHGRPARRQRSTLDCSRCDRRHGGGTGTGGRISPARAGRAS